MRSLTPAEKAANLVRWVRKYAHEPTTTLVARLGLPRDFARCVAVDTIRGNDAEQALRTAACIAPQIVDDSVFDNLGNPHLRAQR